MKLTNHEDAIKAAFKEAMHEDDGYAIEQLLKARHDPIVREVMQKLSWDFWTIADNYDHAVYLAEKFRASGANGIRINQADQCEFYHVFFRVNPFINDEIAEMVSVFYEHVAGKAIQIPSLSSEFAAENGFTVETLMENRDTGPEYFPGRFIWRDKDGVSSEQVFRLESEAWESAKQEACKLQIGRAARSAGKARMK